MSQNHKEKISCSQCGTKQDFVVWSSINISLDPSLKQPLINGDLTTFVCSNCGNDAHVEFNCLYHDMDKARVIWLKHPDVNGVVSIDTPAIGMSSLFLEGYTRRLVVSFHELVDKILTYDDGFVDYTIEVIKLLICIREGIDIECPFHYSGIKTSFPKQKLLRFAVATNEGFIERQYPMKQYLRAVEPIMRKITDIAMEETGEWPHVNRTLILRLMERAGLMRALR